MPKNSTATSLDKITLSGMPCPQVVMDRRQSAIREILRRELITDESPLCAVIDLDTLEELAGALISAYPEQLSILHTIAAKSIALRPILAYFADLGLGCEVASPGELRLAIAAGFQPERIIYDSPAKTVSDIEDSIRLGVSFNIDNFEELARVDRFLSQWEGPIPNIGFRVNPQSGAGTIEEMSTATATAKFGVGLADFRSEIIAAHVSRAWLNQLHVHSGSQGVDLRHTALDVAAVVSLAEEIEAETGEQRIRTIDVGGGLSVNFSSDESSPTFEDHAQALENLATSVFSGKYRLITEFGRSLTAKAGFLLGRVEYVKKAGPNTIAVSHIGVQIATRTVFMPNSWPLRLEIYRADGSLGKGLQRPYDIAGPACFSGDLIATDRMLPPIHSGDLIAALDTGGYYASNHFSYNSLGRSAIFATRQNSNEERLFYVVRRAQQLSEIVAESGEGSLQELR